MGEIIYSNESERQSKKYSRVGSKVFTFEEPNEYRKQII